MLVFEEKHELTLKKNFLRQQIQFLGKVTYINIFHLLREARN